MSKVISNLQDVRQTIPKECTLVAVSKTKPIEDLQEAYDAGQRDFGENKVQELADKASKLPSDIRWHMIGHLQRNKVKYIAPFVHLIHGVDSLKLLAEINKRAKNEARIIQCLLQVHIAEEQSKFGFDPEEITQLISEDPISSLEHIEIIGLMGMATFTKDEDQVRREFNSLQELYQKCQSSKISNMKISTLSMGMSGDYRIAIEEGSNMVRIGSAIFGSREYQ